MLGRENSAPILLGELLAGIEHQAEIGRMGDGLDRWRNRVCRRFAVLVLDRAHRAAAIPWEAEVLPRFGDAVQFARWDVVTHAVHLVVIRPQFTIGWIEI